ncbi:histidine phosphatase family protein [Kiloniella sp. b19]|uniref:histidine phosphatase family protein n=1 Tax=Kiloniella sp. GXU_MW_B19 TaxID=3141326 RepID=UPI0031DF00A7
MTVRLLVLRHGPTVWNAEKRLQGQSDIPLSEAGRVRVAQWDLSTVGHALESWSWFASPLSRASETAMILSAKLPEVPVVCSEPLAREMSWGSWEGERLPDLRERLGEEMRRMERLGLDFCPPQGESPRDVQRRIMPFLERVARVGTPGVLVAHKGILRALYALATGWDMVGKPPEKLHNDTAHLFRLSRYDGQGVRLEPDRLNIPLMERESRE